MPISWLDVILIVIMLISGFLAMVRGFTREVLSIFSWAVAAVAALYLTPKYSGMLAPYINNPSVAQIAFAAGVFIVTLIVVSLITFRISDRVLDSRVGALDRTWASSSAWRAASCWSPSSLSCSPRLPGTSRSGSAMRASYPILQQTQVAIESLLPMNPEQYCRRSLTRTPGAGQPEGTPETPAEGAPAQPSDQRS
jgi:membrane protein required for colicin V production